MSKLNFKRVFILLFFAFQSNLSFSQVTLVPFGSNWNYWAKDQATPPTTGWQTNPTLNLTGWGTGPARLGFGMDGEVTCIPAGTTCTFPSCTPGNACAKFITTYFRTTLNITDENMFSGFTVNIKRDDGAIVYINGTEVFRTNMPADPITYSTLASSNVDAPQETQIYSTSLLTLPVLKTGANVIAVEVHQSNTGSSDLGFDLELTAQTSNQVSILTYGSVWKYQAGPESAAPVGTGWTLAAFDDSPWPQGAARLGYGDDGEVTCIPAGASGCDANPCIPGGVCTKYTTTYFRKKFNITNLNNYSDFIINLVRDDGAVVYVNGTEVFRSNMPGGPVTYNTFASAVVNEGAEEAQQFSNPVPKNIFVEGENIVAVELHQVNAVSSDLGFNLEIVATNNVLNFGDTWKYFANTAANSPGAAFSSPTFNDASWLSGIAKLGYGDDGEVTCVPSGTTCTDPCIPGITCAKYTTTYFRKKITINNLATFSGFTLNIKRDDGAVVYVNGVEVFRTNMPAGAITYSTYAPALITEGAEEEIVITSPTIASSFFVSGENTIAVEIHQNNDFSSDIGFDLQIIGIPSVAANEVIYLLSGAIQSTSAKVNAKVSATSSLIRLAVSTSPTLTSPMYGPYATADAANNFVAPLIINGLTASTKYYYAVESNGILDMSADDIGSFTTAGTIAFNFSFNVGGCGLTGNHPVYTKMASNNPLFNIITGDFHYGNPNSATDINVHRVPYENFILSQTPSRNLLLNYPLAYVWDDHDYSGNDTDSTAAGKSNARLAYREYIPHYPLGAGAVADRPIYQAFTIGRVHFILSDLRSARRTPTMMGDVQKQWFKDQCIFARDNNKIIAWVTSVSWGGNQGDNWGGFTAERQELADFFRTNLITNMFIMSGDAHMSAIDNGNNHDFGSVANTNKYPVLAAAALNQGGSAKGGTYSEAGITIPPNGPNNTYLNPNSTFGQYAQVNVTDNGGTQICIEFKTYRVTNNAADPQSELVSYSFCRNMFAVVPVKMNGFIVQKSSDKKGTLLNWKSENETDCKKYVIERSSDGISFVAIGEVSCKGGSNGSSYGFIDRSVMNGRNFYRVHALDQNNFSTFTEIKSVTFENGAILNIFPNPVRDKLSLTISNVLKAGSTRYVILNAEMRELNSGLLKLVPGSNKHQVSVLGLSRGLYVIRLSGSGVDNNEKFIVE
ncbi:MAG: alkaline phosphatase D family protein [Ferruginibacter sp.]